MAGTTTMPVARVYRSDRFRPPRRMGRIQAAWMVGMDDEHNKINQADLDQFAAENLAEIGKRRWPTTKKPRASTPRPRHTRDRDD